MPPNVARDRAQLKDIVAKECAKLAGVHFGSMLSSYQETQQHLSHSAPGVRLAALKMIQFYWGRTPELSSVCERLALQDPDLDVREMAILCIGGCYTGTYDFRIGKLLAELVHDSNQPAKSRRAAYQALFHIRELLLRNLLVFRFPEDVDWAFVDSFFEHVDRPSEVDRLRNLAPFLDERTCIGLVSWKKAEQALTKGDLQEALARLTESIKYIPGAGTYLKRGQVYMKLGRLDEAISDFSKSIEISPNSSKAHFARGRAYAAKGLSALARSEYNEAIRLDPSYGEEPEKGDGERA